MALPMMPMPRKPILVAPGAAVGTAAAEAAHTWAERRQRGSWAAPCGLCTASLRLECLLHGLRGAGAAANAREQPCWGRTAWETGEAASAVVIVLAGEVSRSMG